MRIVRQSEMETLPIAKQIPKIIATDAIFTASRNDENIFEFLIFLAKGFNNAINKKEGKKIPRVATDAPVQPSIWYPINVTDEETGPGVNCPTAIASINCCLDIIPFETNSVSRKANST